MCVCGPLQCMQVAYAAGNQDFMWKVFKSRTVNNEDAEFTANGRYFEVNFFQVTKH